MAVKRALGIYFGTNSFFIIETEKKSLINFFEAPHSLFDENQQSSLSDIPDEIKLTAIIQKTLRDKKIETMDAYLSLHTKDILLRSFFIPWMTSQEIKGVVDFEARRYIPFKLEELVYGYHSETIVERKSRRIRILFVAIRKDILEKYCSILEQAGLKIMGAEPAPISLLRLLSFKKICRKQKTYALVQTNNVEGTIIIAHRNIPVFIKDFRLIGPTKSVFQMDQAAFHAKLINEIRISIDYYRRQQGHEEVDQILFLSSGEQNEFMETIEKETGIKTAILNTPSLLNLSEEINLGVLNAFGIGLKTAVSFPVTIDLAASRIKPPPTEKVFEQKPVNYLTTVKLAAVCLLLVLLISFLTSRKTSSSAKKIIHLKERVGKYDTLTKDEIDTKRQAIIDKLNQYRNVRLKSNLAFFLSRIPELLPSGVWLREMRVDYPDRERNLQGFPQTQTTSYAYPLNQLVTINLSGYVYAEEVYQQLLLVNRFIENLKKDQEFSQAFDEIRLASAQQEALLEYTVTTFQIICQ